MLKLNEQYLLEGEVLIPVQVHGFEDRYVISNYGRIISLPGHFKRGRPNGAVSQIYKEANFLKPFLNSDGYPIVVLKKEGRRKTCLVHRLVAIHFLPNPFNKEQVNHKDGDKQNFHVSNLEWCSAHANTWHRMRYLQPEGVSQWVYCETLKYYYVSVKEAAYSTGLKESEVLESIEGTGKVKGFEFRNASYNDFKASKGLK